MWFQPITVAINAARSDLFCPTLWARIKFPLWLLTPSKWSGVTVSWTGAGWKVLATAQQNIMTAGSPGSSKTRRRSEDMELNQQEQQQMKWIIENHSPGTPALVQRVLKHFMLVDCLILGDGDYLWGPVSGRMNWLIKCYARLLMVVIKYFISS